MKITLEIDSMCLLLVTFTSFSFSTFATSRTFEKCGQHRSGMLVEAFILLVINMRGEIRLIISLV